MTMGVQATQKLYNESLGCEVLESCPEFKTKDIEIYTTNKKVLIQPNAY